MAKPFTIPTWRKSQIHQKYKRKNKVIRHTVTAMESEMKKAVDLIFEHFEKTGLYVEPSLNGMFAVTDDFYRRCIHEAFVSAKEEKNDSGGHKKLSKGDATVGIPDELKNLDQVFQAKRWEKVMKRSNKLTKRLRKAYLAKLKKTFNKIAPKIHSGEITPQEAKSALMDSWGASKSRVETIFRTETTNYFGRTQVAFFEDDPEIIGFMFDSVRDTSRTAICKSRHGLIYRPGTKLLKDNTPGLHWNCRSHLIALANTPYNRKLLEDPQRDPNKVSVVKLPPGWKK